MGVSTRSGRVQLLTSPTLEPSALTRPARVAWVDDDSQQTVTDSVGLFAPVAFATAPLRWLLVTAASGDPAWFPAQQQVPLGSEELALEAILGAVLSESAEAGLSRSTAEFDPNRAHVLARFTASAQGPRAGVALLSIDGAAVQAAYDAGDLYSDTLETTGERGAAVVLNLPASDPPGSDVLLRFQPEGGGIDQQLIRLSSGRVTLVSVVVP